MNHPPPCTGKNCRLCWLAANDPRYRKRWASLPAPTPAAAPAEPTPIAPLPSPRKELAPVLKCDHLGDVTGEVVACQTCKGSVKLKVFSCAVHGKCNPHRQLPDIAFCPGCLDNTLRAKDARPVDERLARRYAEARKMKWAYGVTTVPSRLQDLLPRTLESLHLAGFGSPRLFVDGQATLLPGEWTDLEKTQRYPPLRTHGNWFLALHELFIRNPDADRYAIFQDDLVTYRNLRAYLEKTPYPDRGYLNLYTVPQNQNLCPKDHTGFYPSNQMGRGAVALVFDGTATIALLSAPHMITRVRNPIRGHKVVDGGIVTAMKEAGFKEYVHSPSLVQHTGESSSMGNLPTPLAPNFLSEEYDALDLLKPLVRV